MSRSITLVCPTQPEQGAYMSAMNSLSEDEQLTIANVVDGKHIPAFVVTPEADGTAFQVAKLHTPDETLVIDGAMEFALEADRAHIGAGTRLSGLLLTPSILGATLFGAETSPGSETEETFGLIHTIHDSVDRKTLLHVVMPHHPYRKVSRLAISKTTL